jgi:UDP-glucuronate 4-epimerase
MNVFLTGAAGFIGSSLAERLCTRGDKVVGLDNFDAFYSRATKERNLSALRQRQNFQMLEGDICNASAVENAFHRAGAVDTLVHIAALAGVRPSLEQPERYYQVNVLGTSNLLRIARAHEVKRVIFASSSSVYGLDSKTPFTENDSCIRPLSPYAASKRAGELLAFTEHHLYETAVTCLRFFTVYGPRQRPDLAIHKFTRLIAQGKPIQLFGDGRTSRDYTWIDDILDGVLAAIDQLRTGFRIYNLGGSRPTSLKELVDRIALALGKTPRIEWKPEQPGDMVHTLANIELAGHDLGYAPKVSLSEGIPRFVSWWQAMNGTP